MNSRMLGPFYPHLLRDLFGVLDAVCHDELDELNYLVVLDTLFDAEVYAGPEVPVPLVVEHRLAHGFLRESGIYPPVLQVVFRDTPVLRSSVCTSRHPVHILWRRTFYSPATTTRHLPCLLYSIRYCILYIFDYANI